MKLKTLAAAVATIGTLTACNIDSVVDDLENSAVDAAFKSVQDAARAQGGDAVLVRPGADYTLEINNPQSAIHGAKVVIPAAAIPADVEQAAVSIYGINGGGLLSTDGYKLNGPVATVAFTKIPDGDKVEPLQNFTITLPYAESATRAAEQMVLANVNQDASLTIFESNGAAGGKVTGGSKTFDRFGAFWQVDFDGTTEAPEGSLIYKVTSSDGSKSCAGLIETVNQRISEKSFRYQAGYGFKFYLIVSGIMTIDTLGDPTAGAQRPVSPNTLDLVDDGPFGAWNVSCTATDGTTLGGAAQTTNTMSVTVGNWIETSAGASETCAGACTPHTGSLDVDAVLDFVADDGSTVKAKLNATIVDFIWYENDL